MKQETEATANFKNIIVLFKYSKYCSDTTERTFANNSLASYLATITVGRNCNVDSFFKKSEVSNRFKFEQSLKYIEDSSAMEKYNKELIIYETPQDFKFKIVNLIKKK